jgi:small-conductance mechanosensitive channel
MRLLSRHPRVANGATPPPLAERVTADFRRAVGFAILAIAAYGVSRGFSVHSASRSHRIAAYGCGAAFVLFALLAVRSLANELARLVRAHAGNATATSLRVLVLIVGDIAILLLALDVFAVPVGNLLLGGAVTGIILGIAAQQALGNVFAGLVLLIARPYVPGQRVRVVGGAVGAQEGVVTSVGLVYTTLATDDGPLNIPNSALLGAGIGPARSPSPGPSE